MLAPISGIRGVAYGAEEGVHRLQFPEATGKMAIPVNVLGLYNFRKNFEPLRVFRLAKNYLINRTFSPLIGS